MPYWQFISYCVAPHLGNNAWGDYAILLFLLSARLSLRVVGEVNASHCDRVTARPIRAEQRERVNRKVNFGKELIDDEGKPHRQKAVFRSDAMRDRRNHSISRFRPLKKSISPPKRYLPNHANWPV